tara:strand:+ start:578 stop:826 length:249 start_codon:yes stop_codon:yes gene_type:complete
MGSWFDNSLFNLGFFIVEAIFIGISYLLVLREVDKYYDDPLIKSPRWTIFRIFLNHIIAMNILLVFVFTVGIVVNIIWGIMR